MAPGSQIRYRDEGESCGSQQPCYLGNTCVSGTCVSNVALHEQRQRQQESSAEAGGSGSSPPGRRTPEKGEAAIWREVHWGKEAQRQEELRRQQREDARREEARQEERRRQQREDARRDEARREAMRRGW
ncbi:hypothetical protein [Myxococcus virescens]|uniref:hypothetical protein n=1 Tax=Myxococcus virescens TaxID=83456 RepID=UPI00115FD83D|nr:hypothetical protein [Myxococcus virescens]